MPLQSWEIIIVITISRVPIMWLYWSCPHTYFEDKLTIVLYYNMWIWKQDTAQPMEDMYVNQVSLQKDIIQLPIVPANTSKMFRLSLIFFWYCNMIKTLLTSICDNKIHVLQSELFKHIKQYLFILTSHDFQNVFKRHQHLVGYLLAMARISNLYFNKDAYPLQETKMKMGLTAVPHVTH